MTALIQPSVSQGLPQSTQSVEVDTTQINRTQTIVHCIVEQMFGGQTNRSISTGQLTIRTYYTDHAL